MDRSLPYRANAPCMGWYAVVCSEKSYSICISIIVQGEEMNAVTRLQDEFYELLCDLSKSESETFSLLRRVKRILEQEPSWLTPRLRNKCKKELWCIISYAPGAHRHVSKSRLVAVETLGILGGIDVRQMLFERLKNENHFEMSEALQKAIDTITRRLEEKNGTAKSSTNS